MTIKFPKGSFVRALDTAYGGGPAYIKGETYEVKRDFHENGSDNATVYTVKDSDGSKSNGWSQKFFEAVPPPQASTAGAASYAHSPGYQQGSPTFHSRCVHCGAADAEYHTTSCPHHVTMVGDRLPGLVFNVKKSAIETQVGGTHYTDMSIQPATYNLANNIGWAEGDAISYISRWRNKGGLQDLRKARQTLLLLIEHEEALGTK